MGIGYYTWGDLNKEVLIFFHGMGGSGLSFGEFSKYLANDFYIISLDLPGHGEAKKLENEEDYLPSNLVKHLHEQIAKLNISTFYLAGFSWGAHIATFYASTYPNEVKGLILLDGGYIQNKNLPTTLEEEIADMETFYNDVRFPSWEAFLEEEKSEVEAWIPELEASSRAMVVEKDGEIRLKVTPDTTKALLKGIYAEETEKVLPNVTCPVLLLTATMPEQLKELREKEIQAFQQMVPNAVVHSIPNTSHSLYAEKPKEVADKIKHWVSD